MEENKNVLVWVLVAVALLFLFSSFGMGSYGMMGLGRGFGLILMLLFWGALIWLVVTLINTAQPGKKKEDLLNMLKGRYASGEISKKQYEEMKKELK